MLKIIDNGGRGGGGWLLNSFKLLLAKFEKKMVSTFYRLFINLAPKRPNDIFKRDLKKSSQMHFCIFVATHARAESFFLARVYRTFISLQLWASYASSQIFSQTLSNVVKTWQENISWISLRSFLTWTKGKQSQRRITKWGRVFCKETFSILLRSNNTSTKKEKVFKAKTTSFVIIIIIMFLFVFAFKTLLFYLLLVVIFYFYYYHYFLFFFFFLVRRFLFFSLYQLTLDANIKRKWSVWWKAALRDGDLCFSSEAWNSDLIKKSCSTTKLNFEQEWIRLFIR